MTLHGPSVKNLQQKKDKQRRESILKNAQKELQKIADQHSTVGRAVRTDISYRLLTTAVLKWSDGSKTGLREARDMLMPQNGIRARNFQEIEALGKELRDLSALSSAVSEYISAFEQKPRRPENKHWIRDLERKLPMLDKSSDDLRRQVSTAVDDFVCQASVDLRSPARIVVCGLLCAGKSSLLNALTDHLAAEYFPTGGGRTTRDCRKYLVQFGKDTCLLVDTPGIDSDDADDTAAKNEMCTADHLLFVHTLATGELHSAEVRLLEDLAQVGENVAAMSGLTVVLTHQESYDEVADQLSGSILATIKSISGKQVPYFRTSAPVYVKGVSEDKSMLVEFSGVPALRGHCREVAGDQDKVLDGRRRRLVLLGDILLGAIDSCVADRECQRQRFSEDRKQRKAAFETDLGRLLNNMTERMKTL